MVQITEMATDLKFPEGPIAMPDGSILLVEIAAGTLTRISAEGKKETVTELGGGPNGAAIGPDGKCYICNNGGFEWHRSSKGLLFPGMQPVNYSGGRIERVDLTTGEAEVLYTECDGVPLKGPNDIVFDRQGGFWFTDHGKTRPRDRDRTGVYYASSNGDLIREAIFPLEAPNGIGLSPDETTLYVAETPTGRLWSYPLSEPGHINSAKKPMLMAQIPNYHLFDSLALDALGNVCVATLVTGGITIHSADGKTTSFVEMPDVFTTNICFGGADLKTAYITLSTTGRLISCEWDIPGLPLNFLNK